MATLYPITLLIISNIFMTFAWYGHLKYKQYPLYLVILVSWAIALFEYCFQVPANRWGHTYFSAVELKTMQEAISIIIFLLFTILYLGETIKLNHCIGLALITAGCFVVCYK